jgi:hypothetical protein
MKDNLQKRNEKLEWDSHRIEENSSHQIVTRSQINDQQQHHQQQMSINNPRSVITSRRHIRTITTAGQITESITDSEPTSPEIVQTEMHNIVHQEHSHGQQLRIIKQENLEPPAYTEKHQYNIRISHEHSPDGQHRVIDNQQLKQQQQHVIFATTNSQEIEIEESEAVESTITMAVEEPSR